MHELKDGMDYDGPLGPVFRYSADFLGISPFAYMWMDPIFWWEHQTYPIPVG